jgi:hypothetical protein
VNKNPPAWFKRRWSNRREQRIPHRTYWNRVHRVDPWGERLVDDFPTQEAAQQDIERCKREDTMYETAQQLMDIAIKAYMQKFGIDRETAQYWIHGAMGG